MTIKNNLTPNAFARTDSLHPGSNPNMNPPIETKPTKPTITLGPGTNPNMNPPEIHLGPGTNPNMNPPIANATPKKITMRAQNVTGFHNSRGKMQLDIMQNRSVTSEVAWVFPKGFQVQNRHFMGKETDPRPMTKTELRTLRSMVQLYMKTHQEADKAGLKRFIQTIDVALKPKMKHPSEVQ